MPSLEELRVPGEGCVLGAYPGSEWLSSLERRIERPMGAALAFVHWGGAFPRHLLERHARAGRFVVLTWEFRGVPGTHHPEGQVLAPEPVADFPLQAIVDGHHDEHVRGWARAAREFGRPVLLRFGHEMNGDWYPWSGAANGGAEEDGPGRFVAAWRHLHRLFQEEGALNVLWLWSPNEPGSLEQAEWNRLERYFPGVPFVDWVGLSGYNWGTSREGHAWRGFAEIFERALERVGALHPSAPVALSEFASAEDGGSKAAWIGEAFEVLRRQPRVRAALWFNLDKETDWRIDSSRESLEAFRAGTRHGHFLPRLPPDEELR